MENFKSLIKRVKWETVLMALTAIIVGIAFIVAPSSSGAVVVYLSGALLLCIGIYCFVKFFTMRLTLPSFMFTGILLILVGIFFLVRPGVVQGLLTVLFGIYLILDGLFKIRDGIECVRLRVKGGWSMFLLAAITIILGLLVMFGSFEDIMIIAGTSLIIDGICDIFTTIYLSAYVHKTKRTIKKEAKKNSVPVSEYKIDDGE